MTPRRPGAGGVIPRALGSTFAQLVTNLPTGNGLLYVAHGFGQFGGMPLPLDLGPMGLPGCSLWIGFEPAMSSIRSFNNGTASLGLGIPNLSILAGMWFGTQVLVLDPSATAGIAALSNGGIGTIH